MWQATSSLFSSKPPRSEKFRSSCSNCNVTLNVQIWVILNLIRQAGLTTPNLPEAQLCRPARWKQNLWTVGPRPDHSPTAERPPLELLCYSSLVGGGILPPTPLYTINVLCAPKPKNLHQSLLNHLGRNFKFIAVTMRQQTITLTK